MIFLEVFKFLFRSEAGAESKVKFNESELFYFILCYKHNMDL